MAGIAELRQMLEDVKAQVKASALDAFKEEFKGVFERHPEVLALRWTQYTPYFNDGDPCIFGVNDLSIKTKDMNPEDAEDDDGFEDLYSKKHPELYAWWGSVECDEAFLAAFGDHAKITVTRDELEIDEYDHD